MKKLITLFALFLLTSASLLLLAFLTANRTGQKVISNIAANSDLVSPLPKSEKILFVSNKSGNYDIYYMDLTTRYITNLTNNPAEDMNPQVSPNGRSMVFYSNRDGTNNIYKTDLDSKTTTQLTFGTKDNFDPSFSPDGKLIVFKSTRADNKGDIFIMNTDGSGQKDLTPNTPLTEEWGPKFSLNGTGIYYVERSKNNEATDEVHIVSLNGTGTLRLTQNAVPDWYPSINPTNGNIAFVSKEVKSGPDHIFTMDANGSQRKKVLTLLSGNNDDPSWNSMGDKIIFINDSNGNYDIYEMSPDGTNLQAINETGSEELSPVFLP